MKGLKVILVLGFVFFASNTHALKLKIVKKSASVGNTIVDQADLDANKTETSFRDKLEDYNDGEIDLEGIKEKKIKIIKRKTATLEKKAKERTTLSDINIKEVEEAQEEDIEEVPAEKKTTDEQTVKNMKKSIEEELKEEISISEEAKGKKTVTSASTGS